MGELYELYPKLPKNIRQIGERDTVLRLYVEDYVNTYLKRLKPTAGQNLRVGLLLGNREIHEDMPYVFVDGAMEMEILSQEGEKVVFTEEAWKKAYQQVETMFPRRTVQGWFLCAGEGVTLSPLNYWRQHSQYFTGKNQLMYLNSGLDGEEAIYITSSDGFYQLRGYSIYYERNQMMQDYMVTRKDARRVESGSHEKVIKDFHQRMTARKDRAIRDFRKKMDEHKTAAVRQRSAVSVLSGLCSVLAVMVLAGGVAMFNNYKRLHEMEQVVASVDPEAVIREARGNLSSVAGNRTTGETPVEVIPETMAPGGSTAGTVEASLTKETPDQTVPPVQTTSEPAQTTAAQTTQAQAANAEASYKVYVVGEGETLYGICFKEYHNIRKLQEICQINSLTDENSIYAGQKLLLP